LPGRQRKLADVPAGSPEDHRGLRADPESSTRIS
jgi:hypothetical protein